MLTRCYRTNRPKTYYDVEVCEDWWKASNFKAWMEKQDWEGKELDKDLLGDGKLYSPETCCFLPKKINIFMKCGGNKTIYPVGVTLHKGRYVSRISAGNSFAKSLGSFGCPTAARVAYLAAKKKYAISIAPLITDENLREVFEERFCIVRDKR